MSASSVHRDKVRRREELKGIDDESENRNTNRLDRRDRAFVSERPVFILYGATVPNIRASGPTLFYVPGIAPWRQHCPLHGCVLREYERVRDKLATEAQDPFLCEESLGL